MNNESEATSELAAIVEQLGLDRAPSRDRTMAAVSMGIAALGPILGIVAYLVSNNTADPLAQRDMIALGLLGVSLSVLGGLLLVRFAFTTYFRFWAARLVAEIRASGAVQNDAS